MSPVVPVVHLRRHLRSHGFDDRELRRMLRDQQLTVVRRGAYLPGTAPGDPVVRHLAQVVAAARQLDADAVLSHVSAAVVHGWDLWRAPLDRVQVTRSRRTGGRRHPSVHVRAAPLTRIEVVDVGGLRVTSPERTAADLARTLPVEQAVVVLDSALAGPLAQDDLREAVRRQKGWPGVPRAGGSWSSPTAAAAASASRAAAGRSRAPGSPPRTCSTRCGTRPAATSARWTSGGRRSGWPASSTAS
jgi:hypothetical protein